MSRVDLVVGVNTYISVEDADGLAEMHPSGDEWLKLGVMEKSRLLAVATQMLDDNFSFPGQAVSPDQTLAWPRQGAWYREPRTGRLEATNSAVALARLARAVCAQAWYLNRNPELLSGESPTFERIEIGAIKLEDTRGSSQSKPLISRETTTLLQPIVSDNAAGMWWRAN